MRPAPLLLLPLFLASCGAGVDRYAVTERIGGPEAAKPEAEQPSSTIVLGRQVRSGWCTRANSEREVSIGGGARRLVFSIGARGAPDPQQAVRFTVAEKLRGQWQPIFEEGLTVETEEWRDRVVDLSRSGSEGGSLRFETTSPRSGDETQAQACWGGVVLLGPDPTAPGALRRILAGTDQSRPNVLLISLDTLGADHLGFFKGYPDVSPNIDAFLGRSFSFRRAYSQYGSTLVSHASLFTGMYPVHHRTYSGGAGWRFESFTQLLAREGYVTAAFTEGGMVSSLFGFASGFDQYDNGAPKMLGDAPRTFARATEWLREFGSSNRFFLFLHTYQVHAPYSPRRPDSRRIAEHLAPGASVPIGARTQVFWIRAHNNGQDLRPEADIRLLEARYTGEVHDLDAEVGTFIQQLPELGLDRDTLVILMADHGELFGEDDRLGHAESLHNRLMHVPLGFSWPAKVKVGSSGTPVGLIDVMPTVLSLVGIPVPSGLDGRDLSELLTGRVPELEMRPLFAEMRSAPGRCTRLSMQINCSVEGYSVQTDRFKLVVSKVPRLEVLYDLQNNSGESEDAGSRYPEELERHRALLARYMEDALPEDAGRKIGPHLIPDSETEEQLRAMGYLE